MAPAEGSIALPAEIWGWAWAAAGVRRVEISVDDGANWREATLEQRRQWSWQRFSAPWPAGLKGPCVVLARATDTAGLVQPMAKARNAVHRIAIAAG